jgi:phosphoribosyl 1,2-cyclic phosphodiesterase
MRVVTLASSSSGNATLIEAGNTALLVDAGLSAKTLTTRLKQAGRAPQDLAGIVLTHEHSDHTTGALLLAQQYQLPLMADARTLAALTGTPSSTFTTPTLFTQSERPIPCEAHPVGSTWHMGDLRIASFAIPHDAAAPCGYLIGTGAWKVCIVTDCGEVTPTILAHLAQAHVIILEANHDHAKLMRGPYTPALKKRILSPIGHLSNDQAAAALVTFTDDTPRWVWLAHLSRTNNTPDLAHTTVTTRLGARRLRTTQVQVAPPGFGLTWNSADLLAKMR